MKCSFKEVASVLLVVAVLVVGSWSGASKVWAQEKGTGLVQQIQGSWILVSIYKEQDDKKTEHLGSNPRGSIIFTPDGRYSAILMRASLPKFASNNRIKGTIEENQAVVQGSFAMFGTYTVASDKEQTVNLHVEGSTFPNWDGQDQIRIMTVNGDELKIVSPFSPTGGSIHMTLKRAKKNDDLIIVRQTAKTPEAVVESIKAYAEEKKWVYLGANKVKPSQGEVTFIKICVPSVGKLLWPLGLKLSAMLPCGNLGVYQKDGTTEISMLHPRYMQLIYPNPDVEKASALAAPLFTDLLDTVTK